MYIYIYVEDICRSFTTFCIVAKLPNIFNLESNRQKRLFINSILDLYLRKQ